MAARTQPRKESLSDEAQQVIIIAGPNGAGKTTLAPFLLRDALKLREYVNADPIALGLSAFDPGSVAFQAGRVMLQRLHELAASKENIRIRKHACSPPLCWLD